MKMNEEAKKKFINSVKKSISKGTFDTKKIGDRHFETQDEAQEALEIAKATAPDKKFEISQANGKFYVEVK